MKTPTANSRCYFLYILFILHLCSCDYESTGRNQALIKPGDRLQLQHSNQNNHNQKKISLLYSQAISDFIQYVEAKQGILFDTLYFGKHVYGQEDDFPDIELPKKINHTYLRLITPEEGEQSQLANPSSYYINLMGWLDSLKADFTFVTFSNGMSHQFDAFLSYRIDTTHSVFILDSTRIENFQFKK